MPLIKNVVAAMALAAQAMASYASASASLDQHAQFTGSTRDVGSLKEIPLSVREHWMNVAKQALEDQISPCPFEAFGTAIVNHTKTDGSGELVCVGVNAIEATGNPVLHGEIAGINNCTAVLEDPSGPYKLSPSEVKAAFRDLTLYTTAEPCPMCASAILWAGFKECIFGTSMGTLTEEGWPQSNISSEEVFRRGSNIGVAPLQLGGILRSSTDPLFEWQFNEKKRCPRGCRRSGSEGSCLPVMTVRDDL